MTTEHQHDRSIDLHDHQHGHAHDRGITGFLRYVKLLAKMWRSPVSDAVVALINPSTGEHVVDLGAGMGPATVTAARRGAHVLAVDPTPYMRRILGARRLAQRTRRRITVVDGAAESIPATDGTTDALWSVNAMHHWTDRTLAAAEITRVLRAGGRAVLVDEDFDDPNHPWYEQFTGRHSQHSHTFDDVNPVEMADLFTAAGCQRAAGSIERVAGRPAKVVRVTR